MQSGPGFGRKKAGIDPFMPLWDLRRGFVRQVRKKFLLPFAVYQRETHFGVGLSLSLRAQAKMRDFPFCIPLTILKSVLHKLLEIEVHSDAFHLFIFSPREHAFNDNQLMCSRDSVLTAFPTRGKTISIY